MSVKLELIKEFRFALKDYQASKESKEILKDIPLVIMLGVTASGRNTIINHLVNTGHYQFIISDTTRPPAVRDGRLEQDGVQYYFRSEQDMLNDIKAGKYLEAEFIHSQYVYGISIRALEVAAQSGKIPVNEVDIGGTIAIRKLKPDTHFFFIVPPSYKEWMYRLKGREVMSDEEFRNRMQTAKNILKESIKQGNFIFIVNDSSQHSAKEIDALVRRKVEFPRSHEEGLKIARQLLKDINREFGTH